ncbi:TVP38/TMEM64 family protein [Ferdinandcohnia sp. Marseille-Q9671]
MQEKLIEILTNYEQYAIMISLLLSIVVSIFGVLPSVFITAANLVVFGVWQGTLISFLGEVLGAIVSFGLYRKGFKKITDKKKRTYTLVNKLLSAKGKDAFTLVLFLRLLPFVPSGLITFTAAIGEMSFIVFIIASSLGKVPSLLMEAYSVYHVTSGTTVGKIILSLISLGGIVYLLGKLVKKEPN